MTAGDLSFAILHVFELLKPVEVVRRGFFWDRNPLQEQQLISSACRKEEKKKTVASR
jgi:hypothetical protein